MLTVTLSGTSTFDDLLTIEVASIRQWASEILVINRDVLQFLNECLQITHGVISVPTATLEIRVGRLMRKVDDAMALAEVIGLEISGEDG